MHLYLDSADAQALTPLLRLPIIYGVTTNPTLQRRVELRERDLERFVRSCLADGARAVQVQVKGRAAGEMVEQARRFVAWGDSGRVIPKIPATREGLIAVSELARGGVRSTVTAAFEPEQALWALLAGARYVAPYLGRLNDQGRDGLAVIADMQRIVARYQAAGNDCRLLVASVRTIDDFRALLELGVGAVTVAPPLLEELLDNRATTRAEDEFLVDAEAVR
ncbi:MAG: transaldolase family protein [Trueperaceae bacterium]